MKFKAGDGVLILVSNMQNPLMIKVLGTVPETNNKFVVQNSSKQMYTYKAVGIPEDLT